MALPCKERPVTNLIVPLVEGNFTVLHARVPLAELYRYSTTLSSITSGRGTFTMTFIEYQQVPMDVQEKLLKAYEEEEKDE